jgi:hypothetical protein
MSVCCLPAISLLFGYTECLAKEHKALRGTKIQSITHMTNDTHTHVRKQCLDATIYGLNKLALGGKCSKLHRITFGRSQKS